MGFVKSVTLHYFDIFPKVFPADKEVEITIYFQVVDNFPSSCPKIQKIQYSILFPQTPKLWVFPS